MTHTETMMLAVCFGAVVGTFIGNAITAIQFFIEEHKEKKRRRLEEAKNAEE